MRILKIWFVIENNISNQLTENQGKINQWGFWADLRQGLKHNEKPRAGQRSMTRDDERIHVIGRQRRTPPNEGRYPKRNSRLEERDEENQRSRERRELRCQNCGGDAHKRRNQCPAKGKTYHKCKSNHSVRMCRSTRVDYIVDEENRYSSEEDHCTDLFIWAISSKM